MLVSMYNLFYLHQTYMFEKGQQSLEKYVKIVHTVCTFVYCMYNNILVYFDVYLPERSRSSDANVINFINFNSLLLFSHK
jgi:hypothetical protein